MKMHIKVVGHIIQRCPKKCIHILRKEKLYYNGNNQYIPITRDEYKSRVTSVITRGAHISYHQCLDTSDYGKLLLEQR
jgi:hypothetical protein